MSALNILIVIVIVINIVSIIGIWVSEKSGEAKGMQIVLLIFMVLIVFTIAKVSTTLENMYLDSFGG